MRVKFWARSVILLGVSVFVETATAATEDRACELPQELQSVIASKFPGAMLVNLSNLYDFERKIFQKEHGKRCPGLVKVDFYGDGKPTLALVLRTRGPAAWNASLVVAHKVGRIWGTILLETDYDESPVVWMEPPGKYLDVYGEKEIRAAKPVIVFCQYYAWAILYAWTGKDVAKIWMLD
jgi:hypothetical protein